MLRPLTKKMAFVHIPRTAGVFVLNYLRSLEEYTIYNSYDAAGRDDDWTESELLDLSKKPALSLVHNHSYGWTKKVARGYKANNWFLFSFMRDPREQICSFYYFMQQHYPERTEGCSSLDEFIVTNGLSKSSNWLPDFWRELDYFKIFSVKTFAEFLAVYFRKRYRPSPKANVSRSKGFRFYWEQGEISSEARAIIENTDFFDAYKELGGTE